LATSAHGRLDPRKAPNERDRFSFYEGETVAELERRGRHIPQVGEAYMDFGCAQLALKVDGGYVAASDPRRDSLAIGF
jgi:gamma-glutamyltranspeptidase/glutathione hydrolase